MQSFKKSIAEKTNSLLKPSNNSLLPSSTKQPTLKSLISNKPISSIAQKISSVKPVESIKQSASTVKDSIVSVGSTVAEKTSGFINFKFIIFVILFILFLAFIGINIFNYLGKGTDIITTIMSPFVYLISLITGDTSKTAIKHTSDGSKGLLDAASSTSKTILDNIEKGTTSGISTVQDNIKKTSANNKPVVLTENEDSIADPINQDNNNTQASEPEPTRTNALNQGYCYIGKINDTRYCAKVSSREQCMSGDIYPSMDICVNPSLRA